MSRTGVIVIVIGLALVAISAFADVIGLGSEEGFGSNQVLGVAVGVAVVIAGAVVGSRQARSPDRAG